MSAEFCQAVEFRYIRLLSRQFWSLQYFILLHAAGLSQQVLQVLQALVTMSNLASAPPISGTAFLVCMCKQLAQVFASVPERSPN